MLQRDDGSEVTLKLKNVFFDPVPQIVANEDQVIKVTEPLKWYQWVWSGLPILLVFAGGAIGALFGIIASSISIRVFRSQMATGRTICSRRGYLNRGCDRLRHFSHAYR